MMANFRQSLHWPHWNQVPYAAVFLVQIIAPECDYIVWHTLFGGRSPACSQSCKIVRLPPSGMGSDSAICVCMKNKRLREVIILVTPILTFICCQIARRLYI